LSFHNANLVNFPSLAGVRSVEHLDLSYNGMRTLPERTTVDLPRDMMLTVRVVQFVGNALDYAPNVANFLKLAPNLRTAQFAFNSLAAVPDLRNNAQLQSLDLSDNQIRSVYPAFLPRSLRELDLSGTDVADLGFARDLPPKFSLTINDTPLRNVDFADLTNLIKLSVTANSAYAKELYLNNVASANQRSLNLDQRVIGKYVYIYMYYNYF
jgi:Leucine-rich repeat (LRR) protein